MKLDFIKLAEYIKDCHTNGKNWRIPAMSISDMAKLLNIIEA